MTRKLCLIKNKVKAGPRRPKRRCHQLLTVHEVLCYSAGVKCRIPDPSSGKFFCRPVSPIKKFIFGFLALCLAGAWARPLAAAPSPTNGPTPGPVATTTPDATPSILGPGDVMFVGFAGPSSSGKQFAFMLMKNVNAGTILFFSNNTYSAATGLSSVTSGYVEWQATQYYPAGSVIYYTRVSGSPTPGGGTFSSGNAWDGNNGGGGIGWSQPKLMTIFQATPVATVTNGVVALQTPVFISAAALGQEWNGVMPSFTPTPLSPTQTPGGPTATNTTTGTKTPAPTPATTSIPGSLVDGSSAVAFPVFPDWATLQDNCTVPTVGYYSGTESSLNSQFYADQAALSPVMPVAWEVNTTDTSDALSTATPGTG